MSIEFETSSLSEVARDRKIQDLIFRKHFDAAEKMLGEKLTRNPQSADAYFLQGVLSYFRGSIKPTIEHLRKALAIDNKHTDAAICLAVLLNDLGRYDEAKKIFEIANQSIESPNPRLNQSVDRKFAVKHLELADLYYRYRRFDESIEEYGKAILLDPQALDLRVRRAKALSKKGALARAVQELQTLKHEHPNYFSARNQLGLVLYQQGHLLDAEIEWEAVLQVDPQNREALTLIQMIRALPSGNA